VPPYLQLAVLTQHTVDNVSDYCVILHQNVYANTFMQVLRLTILNVTITDSIWTHVYTRPTPDTHYSEIRESMWTHVYTRLTPYTHCSGTIRESMWTHIYIHLTPNTHYSDTIWDSMWTHVYTRPRGGRFNFLLTPIGGWVGVELAAPGFFLIQTGRFLVVPKFKYLN